MAPGCICTRCAFRNLIFLKILRKILKTIRHKQFFNNFSTLYEKDKFLTKKHTFRSHFWSEIFFFEQSRKFVIFCRKFLRVFVTCVCLCPIFFIFFRSIFIFLKFRKAYRVHMHPGDKMDFWKYNQY